VPDDHPAVQGAAGPGRAQAVRDRAGRPSRRGGLNSGSAELRKKLHAVTSLGEVEGIFEDYLERRDEYAANAAESEPAEPLETAEV